MGWHDALVYYRDFAYSTPRLRMATGNIGLVPAQTFAELLSGPMIDVYVGDARRRWTLHRNLLCHHSATLEAELEGTGGDRKDALELPEHDPAGFELLVKWLYQGTLDDVADIPDATHKYEYAVRCHALYRLCERFDMAPLKNVAMDQFRKGLNESQLVPDADELDELYRKSPVGSPFRRLLVNIAARQLMDPDSERDADTYRQCLAGNPDFAVELINAIRRGTGGLLLDDPTEQGHECAYHDHEDGPHCNVKAKGKAKQAPKARARPAPPSAKSPAPSTSSDPPTRPRRPPPSPPLQRAPPPPARPPRPGSSAAAPLLRRLTSPATSTAGTSTEPAVASRPPSPEATKDWERLKRQITPEPKPQTTPEPTKDWERPKPLPARDAPHPSSDAASPRPPHEAGEGAVATNGASPQSPPRRGIWEWARAGTGRLNIMSRLPHPEGKSPASASKAEGVVNDTVPAAAKLEGLGISPWPQPPTDFSQTAGSSDDLIANASETTGSPSPLLVMKHGGWTNGDDTTPTASKPSSPTTPDTPTPPQQRRSDSIMDIPKTRDISRDSVDKSLQNNIKALTPGGASTPKTPLDEAQTETEPGPEPDEPAAKREPPSKTNGSANSSQRRVPTYKIALAPGMFSPAMRNASRSASAASASAAH